MGSEQARDRANGIPNGGKGGERAAIPLDWIGSYDLTSRVVKSLNSSFFEKEKAMQLGKIFSMLESDVLGYVISHKFGITFCPSPFSEKRQGRSPFRNYLPFLGSEGESYESIPRVVNKPESDRFFLQACRSSLRSRSCQSLVQFIRNLSSIFSLKALELGFHVRPVNLNLNMVSKRVDESKARGRFFPVGLGNAGSGVEGRGLQSFRLFFPWSGSSGSEI
ncbi:E3 UFM1-protein ligase 1 homolog [Striga asiatica]|uniref:E3 UFM1-protein ligase 1 homolog n=1 Tax=Striga asiatica TaxID=4170 RepID=A0A5A7PZL5_STRAF|nr:E3 UFM1-protein ligase 1 homolog [Striga asiatica]